jgi:cellulose synthase/poly-beta-1,6-N-acetylglucosamine synthase-like glycosyltransferase
MTILETLALSVIIAHALTALALWHGAYLSLPKKSSPPASNFPTVSLLLAARNEEQRLPACLASLSSSDYPHDRLQILVVNDRSSDRTQQIAEAFAQRDDRIHVLALTQRLPGMSGKASALCQGMKHACGEIILLTDADCIVPRHWVRAMVAHFTPEAGLVGGFTLLSPSPALRSVAPPSHRDTLFAKIQTLDWMYLLAVGAGAAGLGKPVSILGNNFGFRREAYEQIGGYEKLGFSIIEDFALMRKIAEKTPWRVRFALDAATAIFSFPSPTWREYIDQRRRWAAGGKEVGTFAKFLMLIAFLARLGLLLAAFFSPLVALFGLAAILLVDALLLWRCAAVLQYQSLLKYFPLFEIYFLIYSLVLAMTVIFPATVAWKGRRYRWNMWGRITSVEE